jgi:outer membrane receptor protein involved in Fe transport
MQSRTQQLVQKKQIVATFTRPGAIALACMILCAQAQAETAKADQSKAEQKEEIATVEISSQSTRSTVSLRGSELQKILPGTNPVKGLQTLPGVAFTTADPWGNNEQNLSLFVHGFNGQQLGYTMDGVPLGDQQYGNYNGLSPQRAVISENVRNVILSSGAGSLSTASTSNLGGTIEVFSADPLNSRQFEVQQTIGSNRTTRTYLRADTGDWGNGTRAYVSALHHDAKAWDFDGHQKGNQFNTKLIHLNDQGKLTFFFNYNDKVEPNEDATVHVANETSAPYTRPFMYPDWTRALNYLSATGATPAADGNNYLNYFSAAQRTDWLSYLKYEWNLNDSTTFSNQVYFHKDDGRGIVAGPITAAGLPALFSVYFPNQNLKQIFGNSGYATRTTEYQIHRYGWLSNLKKDWGTHHTEAGLWLEYNDSSAYRRWYATDVNNPGSPYVSPQNPLITQYGSQINNHVMQLYLQDEWRLQDNMTLQTGVKSSLQNASGHFPVQPAAGAISGGSLALPVGEISTKRWFLPQIGLLWDLSKRDQLFANIQKNMRQFVTYGAGGASPWSLASQSAFDLFKSSASPETSVTYEAGWRGKRNLDIGMLNRFDGQINVYHVEFHDRILQISPTPTISAIVGGNPVLANVGGVKTDGIDLAGTFYFGKNFTLYNGLSYNRSLYKDDYSTGKTTVATSGKVVPGAPEWMNKLVATYTSGNTEVQVIGDYMGKRYATYTNDLAVGGNTQWSLGVTQKLGNVSADLLKNMKLRLNVQNLTNTTGASSVVVGAASGTYNTYPLAPRAYYLTFSANFN